MHKKALTQNAKALVFKQKRLLAGIQFFETFHQIINRFHLLEERFQFSQRQRGWTITFRMFRIRMRFNKQPRQTYRHTGTCQLSHLSTTTAGTGGSRSMGTLSAEPTAMAQKMHAMASRTSSFA